MRSSRFSRRRTARAVALGVTVGALLVVAGSFAGASGAGGASARSLAASSAAFAHGYPASTPDDNWAWQKFHAQSEADVNQLTSLGIDVTEGTAKNADGSADVQSS